MALAELYALGRVIRSDSCFDKGVAEIGGAEKIAPLWVVQEERPKMKDGANASGRVKPGVIAIPADYGCLNSNSAPLRAIALKGLPLLNVEEATQANKDGKYYCPDRKKYAQAILDILISAVPIDEKDIENNILEMKLEEFVTKYTLSLFGGEGNEQERTNRVNRAGEYFREELNKAGKKNVNAINLYLPPFGDIEKSRGIIGTQIFACGLDRGFGLIGGSGGLDCAVGVFGVS